MKQPSKFAVRLATKLCPPEGWKVDAAAIIEKELSRERKLVRREVARWRQYLDELDGVE